MSKMFRGGIAVEFNAETNATPMQTAAALESALKEVADKVRQTFGADVKVAVQSAFVRPQNRKPKGEAQPAAPAVSTDPTPLEEAIASAEPIAEAAE